MDRKPLIKNSIDVEASVKKKTNSPTFVISISHTQNSTWQGSIKWLEGEQSYSFRSILEMLKLMEQAQHLMDMKDIQFQSWK